MTTKTIECAAIFGRSTAFRVTARRHPSDLSSFDRTATVSVDTGACNVQTYLTPEQCDELAAMLTEAAQEVRHMIANPVEQVAA